MPGQNECRPLPACPVETTLTLIGDKWKVLILRDLLTGTETVRRAEKVAWRRVAEGADGAASRDGGERAFGAKGLRGGPARVEYSLTALGLSLRPILDAMQSWGKGYQGCPPLIGYSRRPAYPKLKAWGTPGDGARGQAAFTDRQA